MPVIRPIREIYCSSLSDDPISFTSIQELLNIDFVEKPKQSKLFYQYSVTESGTLMAEFEEGNSWEKIGSIMNAGSLLQELPQWEYKRRRKG